MDSIRGALAALTTGLAATLVIVAVSIVALLNPVWVGFAQGRAQAEAWTGFTTAQLAEVTNPILWDLVVGPPDFDVALDGSPVLKESERSHMRDVRGVFAGLFAAAAVAGVVLAAQFVAARGSVARQRLWRRLARTGVVIVGVTIVGGIAGLLLFDTAFILFHEVFFPGGNYLFDYRTDRLVQLFPEQFWVETTIAVGVVIIGLALLLTLVARRRAARLASRAAIAGSLGTRPVPAR
jgi:integral membrane protein (TIGR01906 family)